MTHRFKPVYLCFFVMACCAPATVVHAYSQGEKSAFLKADANGDLKISSGEFRTLINELVAIGSEKAVSVKKWGVYGYAFKRIDADKDGMITPEELQAQR